MTYDENRVRIILNELEALRLYIHQNESEDVRRRRRVRELLRGLHVSSHEKSIMEGKTSIVVAPIKGMGPT